MSEHPPSEAARAERTPKGRRALTSRLSSLSARLLLLTVFFIMLGEVLIFVPSVARYRLTYLEDRIASAHLAILALEATPDNMVSQALANELLAHVGAHGIVLHKPNNTTLMIDAEMPPAIDATYDLRMLGFFGALHDTMVTLAQTGNRILRVLEISPKDPMVTVEVLLDETPMRREMWAFGMRVLELSVVLSAMVAALVYLSLQWLLVAPLRRLTASMIAFRGDPEDASRVMVPGGRSDEIGVAERELAGLQETVRQALRQNAHLVALGTAVTKINHDLRNILSTARLVSDGLADSEAPEVRRVTPRLVAAIDRAVALCTRTLDYTREGAPPLRRRPVALAALAADLGEALGMRMAPADEGEGRLPPGEAPLLEIRVPSGLAVAADRDQLYRALFNLMRNALEAGARHLTVGAAPGTGGIEIEIGDDGPGLPPKARDNLFRPFAGSARRGGTGLGLAIAREVMRAHGGDIALIRSTAAGTVFRLTLPQGNGPAASLSRAPAPGI